MSAVLKEDTRAGQGLSQAVSCPSESPTRKAPRAAAARHQPPPGLGRCQLVPRSGAAAATRGLLIRSVSGILGLSPGTAPPTTHPQLARSGGLFPEMEQIFRETVNLATDYGLNG